jgi:hypothetical protein
MIYFIQDDVSLAIKIGFTTRPPRQRLKELQESCPSGLTLLFTMPGGPFIESKLHKRFVAAYVRGEWFRPVPALIHYMIQKAIHYDRIPEDSPLLPQTSPQPSRLSALEVEAKLDYAILEVVQAGGELKHDAIVEKLGKRRSTIGKRLLALLATGQLASRQVDWTGGRPLTLYRIAATNSDSLPQP